MHVAKKPIRKIRRAAKKRGTRHPGPSFAEGMRPFIGIVKNAPPELSMREGFGD